MGFYELGQKLGISGKFHLMGFVDFLPRTTLIEYHTYTLGYVLVVRKNFVIFSSFIEM